MSKKVKTVNLPANVAFVLERLSEYEDRTQVAIITRALKLYIEQEDPFLTPGVGYDWAGNNDTAIHILEGRVELPEDDHVDIFPINPLESANYWFDILHEYVGHISWYSELHPTDMHQPTISKEQGLAYIDWFEKFVDDCINRREYAPLPVERGRTTNSNLPKWQKAIQTLKRLEPELSAKAIAGMFIQSTYYSLNLPELYKKKYAG